MGIEKGFGLDLSDRIDNQGTTHWRLVEDIERITKRNLISYTSFLRHPAGALMDEDADFLERILKSLDLEKSQKGLDLMLHSPGGSPVAAEKVIIVCRSYAKSFRVIIPKTAMSAATLVAMGADEIVMSDTSGLGPIDPQMVVGVSPNQTLRPAAAYIDAYLDLVNKARKAIAGGTPAHPFLQLLVSKMDPSWIQICLKARELSQAIAVEYLGRYNMKGKHKRTVRAAVNHFMKTGEKLSHGRTITPDKAQTWKLNIKKQDKNGALWNKIWELHVRCENYVQTRGLTKYIVCRKGGIDVRAKTIKAFAG